MGKASAPATPDYAGAANATAAGNLDAARVATKANRVDTYTPYGNLTYTQSPTDQDIWSSKVDLSPTGQSLLDQQNKTSLGLSGLQDAATGKVAAQQASGWNDSAVPGMGEVYNPTAATNNATDLINTRLAPQQEQDRNSLAAQLANQGLAPGSEAWKAAETQLGQTQNDAKNQAALTGIQLGQQQQQQEFNQGQTSHQQGLQDQNYYNTRDLNTLNAIRTGSQVTNPTFQQSPQQATTAGPNLLGAAQSEYQSNLNSVNAQNGASGNFLSGLFGLGSAGMMSPTDTFSNMFTRA